MRILVCRSLLALGLSASALLSMTSLSEASAQLRSESEHGFWRVLCEKPPGAKFEQCAIHHAVQDLHRPELGLAITLLRAADRKADILRLQAPLGILLPKGIGLEIDGQDFGTISFSRCFADGCWAYADANEELIEAMSHGEQAIFKLFPSREQGVGLPVALEGFARAYEAMP